MSDDESFQEQLSRVRQMAESEGEGEIWDLSANDTAALRAVLTKLAEAQQQIEALRAEVVEAKTTIKNWKAECVRMSLHAKEQIEALAAERNQWIERSSFHAGNQQSLEIQLTATREALRQLVEKWRAASVPSPGPTCDGPWEGGAQVTFEQCADELEAKLRGTE